MIIWPNSRDFQSTQGYCVYLFSRLSPLNTHGAICIRPPGHSDSPAAAWERRDGKSGEGRAQPRRPAGPPAARLPSPAGGRPGSNARPTRALGGFSKGRRRVREPEGCFPMKGRSLVRDKTL